MIANTTKIRSIIQSDKEQWKILYRQYADFYQVPMTEEILEQTFSWLVDGHHPEEGLVAELPNGELVGIAHYRAFPKPLLGKDAGFLDDLFVLPTLRGSGIGRQLIEAVAAIAAERGWPLVRWITAPDNHTARKLYDGVAQAAPWVTYDLALKG
ncbi:MAG: GNAT family N-acetyltransferase [Comamonas sp.]